MEKNSSILLGDYFESFVNKQVESGRFSSASEVVRTAMRLFEQEENKKTALIKELEKGEQAGFIKEFNRQKFVANLSEKYIANEL